MEALNKLERLVQLLFMRNVKVDEIKWHSFELIKFRGLYIDAYYTINRTESSGTCDEFKHTVSVMWHSNIPQSNDCFIL
ncbi:unnamed protein product [Dicrocoelium dendriticum]|nr:unnamed protein product [Dicrocoelium dendriticum]